MQPNLTVSMQSSRNLDSQYFKVPAATDGPLGMGQLHQRYSKTSFGVFIDNSPSKIAPE